MGLSCRLFFLLDWYLGRFLSWPHLDFSLGVLRCVSPRCQLVNTLILMCLCRDRSSRKLVGAFTTYTNGTDIVPRQRSSWGRRWRDWESCKRERRRHVSLRTHAHSFLRLLHELCYIYVKLVDPELIRLGTEPVRKNGSRSSKLRY